MANPHKGDAPFTVGDVTYTLRFTFDALVEIEEHFGRPIVRVFQDLMTAEDGPRLKDARFIIWQAIRHHHQDVDVKAAGELILEAMQDRTLFAVLERAAIAAFPAPREDAADPPRQPPNGTGPS